MSDTALRTGGCQCGAVRYEVRGEALGLVVCHCEECRKQSASAFGVSLFVPPGALRVTRGTPQRWSRPAGGGRVLDCMFCPRCGSRLWHQHAGTPERISVKGGSLDEPLDLSVAVHIWTSRMLPGVVLPAGVRRHDRNPQ